MDVSDKIRLELDLVGKTVSTVALEEPKRRPQRVKRSQSGSFVGG